MRDKHAALLLFCLGVPGCLRPLQTESKIALTTPLQANVTPELPHKDAGRPLTEMPVDGPAAPDCGPRVAVIDVDGLLLNQNFTGPYSAGENPVDLLREKLDAAACDPAVCALVLRINSPGGSVTATDIMWREVQKFRPRTRRPVVACLMDTGCSGAYYLATASDVILAHPTTITGGIGVILNLYNLQDALGLINIVRQPVKAGPNIDLGNITAPLPADSRRILQAMADELHQRFQTVVKEQRPQVDFGDGTTFDGRVFTAQQALQRKLIDRIGYLDDALNAAREMAAQPSARAVLYHRGNDPARTPYAITPNHPLQGSLLPISIPGIDRSRLSTFLYLWQPDPTLERQSGRY
jgi:protease-4